MVQFLTQARQNGAAFRLRDSAVSDSRSFAAAEFLEKSAVKDAATSMRLAFHKGMQATLPLHQPTMNSQKNMPQSPAAPAAEWASVEIHSYLAARDLLLRETDANPTESNLRRTSAANEFAESCLRPARSPYQAQALPEAEAARERLRCHVVKMRLAHLRSRPDLRRRAARLVR
jgi:hypothetical protein